MFQRKIHLLSALIVLIMAGIVANGLWMNYEKECQGQARIQTVRGQTILLALESSLRSHRRMGGGFEQNVQSLVEESAQNEGIIGLGIYDRNGSLLSSGGRLPKRLTLQTNCEWTSVGLLMTHESQIREEDDSRTDFSGFGRGRGRQMAQAVRMAYQGPVHLAVLLDDTEYRQALTRERWRFTLSLGAVSAVFVLGLGMIFLLQRHGRLRADLNLAVEREKRLEELAQLGAGLAHETKNPLSLIRGLAQRWLSCPGADDDLRQEARQIVNESDRVVGRINSFLQYSRLPEPSLQAVALAPTLDGLVGLFQDEARSKGVSLKRSYTSAYIRADLDMLRQIVVNLLANALAFCKQGDTIELSLLPDRSGDSTRATLCVRDTGCGIAPEDLPQVTKPYFTRRAGGTGLGLAIVRQIAEAHGWTLEIHSSVGQGTSVCLSGLRREKEGQS
jgi:signal transduction histidine kinase